MLQAFLALVKPASTIAKPACMKNTKNAATQVQTMLRFNCNESEAAVKSVVVAGATASAASAAYNQLPVEMTMAMLIAKIAILALLFICQISFLSKLSKSVKIIN
jgi:hypothetical protein